MANDLEHRVARVQAGGLGGDLETLGVVRSLVAELVERERRAVPRVA